MALCLLLSGAAPRARALRSDAFIWQLAWTPALADAVAGQRRTFAVWHVLAADIPDAGSPVLARADWTALLAGGHAALPVIRIEGQLTPDRAPGVLAAIVRLVAGLPPAVRAGVEIDHDAATGRLGGYAAFLRAMRASLPPGTALWATALPTWLGAPGFGRVADAVDRLVLQVHAADDPRLGVFDAGRALDAVRRLGRRAGTPFLVSLPAYGARVSVSEAGLRVASEAALLDGQAGAEMAASPDVVAGFLRRLRADPPDGLVGLVWFRLPVAGDRRAWGAATLRRVAEGAPLEAHVAVLARPARAAGVTDILVANTGATDGVLPRRIALPPGCVAADGLGQYVVDDETLVLRGAGAPAEAGLLPAGGVVPAGWMRCAPHGAGDLHAQD
jgi:hypothetical protein